MLQNHRLAKYRRAKKRVAMSHRRIIITVALGFLSFALVAVLLASASGASWPESGNVSDLGGSCGDARAYSLTTKNNESYLVSPPRKRDAPPRVVFLLHGSAGNASGVMCDWESARPAHDFWLVSATWRDDAGQFQPATEVYATLKTIRAEMNKHEPRLANAPTFLVGVSRGARQAIAVSLLDHQSAAPLFDAFALISASWWTLEYPEPDVVRIARQHDNPQTLAGVTFWVYCGDLQEAMCPRVEKTVATLKRLGAHIADFVRDPAGRHGMFHGTAADATPGASVTKLVRFLTAYRR
jgi:hypothetical protein